MIFAICINIFNVAIIFSNVFIDTPPSTGYTEIEV